MMTIYTSLKSGDARAEEIQRVAMENWRQVMSGCEIVTFEGKPPMFGEIVRRVNAGADRVAMYANADVLFPGSIRDVLAWCEGQVEDFLIVGQRTDALKGGQRELHRPSGMDYFIFRRGMFGDLPPTIMGRSYCDSAILAYCLRRGIRVVDATDVMMVVHQWHDYGHVAGGREEVFGGEEARANKWENGLRDFGPHIADVKWKFATGLVTQGRRSSGSLSSPDDSCLDRSQFLATRVTATAEPSARRIPSLARPFAPSPCARELTNELQGNTLVVIPKRVGVLRRLGLWGVWNRLTHGGLGFWGIHEYVGRQGCRYFTRSKVELWSPNSNVQMRFKQVVDAERGIWSGFDFPCMWKAWREREIVNAEAQRRRGTQSELGGVEGNKLCGTQRLSDSALKNHEVKWTVFLWDPPSLGHRDKFPPLRWAIDFVFRWFARRCDRLEQNILPGCVEVIWFSGEEVEKWRKSGKLVCRMQDAFEAPCFNAEAQRRKGTQSELGGVEEKNTSDTTQKFEYDLGVLSNWTTVKGGPLMAKALKMMPGVKCLWIGDPPRGNIFNAKAQRRRGTQSELGGVEGCSGSGAQPQLTNKLGGTLRLSDSALKLRSEDLTEAGICFAGRLPQDEAFERLSRCRILVAPYLNVPSLRWNYVLKLFEYLQLGRPILASDNPGNAAVAEKYRGRITLFKAGDVLDFVAKCAEVDHERFYGSYRKLQERLYKESI